MFEPLYVDLWSDVVCPFCYLGSRRLARAIADFAHGDEVTVRHHAFELDPRAPLYNGRTLDELVAAKYQMPIERAESLHRRLEREAAALDMSWSFAAAKATNTFDAHRLIALAATTGRSGAMSQRLFAAYFEQGQLISDHGVLLALAEEVGVDAANLLSGDSFSDVVRDDEAQAMALGIGGVPAMVIDEKFMVAGAQEPDQITAVLERAWTRRA